METIKERRQMRVAGNDKLAGRGKDIVFPEESVSKFCNKREELQYVMGMGITDEVSAFFDDILALIK